MTATQSEKSNTVQPQDAFAADELQQLLSRIRASGVLGRSRTYSVLLDYLVDCSVLGKSPKEIEIAMEALGKNPDFDVTRDSSVRVYVHQLRKKLDKYYQTHEPDAEYRLVIPKGQYAVAAIAERPAVQQRVAMVKGRNRHIGTGLVLLAVLVLLAANLLVTLLPAGNQGNQPASLIGASTLWGSVIDDDLPIMLVLGDYYIFGELNAQGNIGRMVRDFSINSQDDLEERHFSDWEATHNYQDLDLSYIPEGSAYALARIIPLLSASGKRFHVAMMSDLSTVDIRENHIVYIGYISALDKLSDIVFAGSSLQIGRSYDELLNTMTDSYYTSDAGLPEEGQQFRDYGFFTTFPASSENQILIIGGMRDAGLMYTAQALSEQSSLRELERLIKQRDADGNISLEALYEVYGVDRMHFNGQLVYSDRPEPASKWRPDHTGNRY